MKRFLLFFAMIFGFIGVLFAQDGSTTEVVLDFTTFTGLAAIVGMAVTQVTKLIPYVKEHTWCKILIALALGVVICLLTKLLRINSPVLALSWGATAIYGIFTGSVSAGLYDLFKMIYNLFKKDDSTTE